VNEQPTPSSDSFSPSRLQRVDEICDRFEDAWKAGLRPWIEDYLAGTVEREPSALLWELIALEISATRTPEEFRLEKGRSG
jgi:hypothetical protein